MFISKVTFDAVPHFLNYKNVDKEHQFTMSLFPETEKENPRAAFQILYVYNQNHQQQPSFLIQSNIAPSIDNIKNENLKNVIRLETKDTQNVYQKLLEQKEISYKVKANPVKTINNKLQPVRGQDNILNWWEQITSRNGFQIDKEQIQVSIEQSVRKDKHTLFATATITGRGKIVDSDSFSGTVQNGIGKEKSYGYGLILLGS